jgi:hypothetical protein
VLEDDPTAAGAALIYVALLGVAGWAVVLGAGVVAWRCLHLPRPSR